MIGRLVGTLAHKAPPLVLVDVGGVGWEVSVPMSTFFSLPRVGDQVTLLTQQVIREDAHFLYGFLTHDERQTFRELLKVSGVGPRTALALLSGVSAAELAQAVALQQTGRLTSIPGIGKKTAERLLLELRGKLADALTTGPTPTDSAMSDVVQALVALGYSEKEAVAAVKKLPAGMDVAEGIKQALKALA